MASVEIFDRLESSAVIGVIIQVRNHSKQIIQLSMAPRNERLTGVRGNGLAIISNLYPPSKCLVEKIRCDRLV